MGSARSARAVVGGVEFVDLTSNKTYKSLPRAKKGEPTRLIERYRREFAPAKKNLREGAKELLSWFEDRMHKRDAWSGAFFREHLLMHPMAKPLLRGLVLEFDNPQTKTRGFCRLDNDDVLIDIDFEPVDITQLERIWIPTREVLGGQLDAWVKHMIEFQILQPFEQLGASDFDLDDEHTRTLLGRIYSGDYKVDIRAIRKLEKAELIEVENYSAPTPYTPKGGGVIAYEISGDTFCLLLVQRALYLAWHNLDRDPIPAIGFKIGSRRHETLDDLLAALGKLDESTVTELLRFLQKLEHQEDT